MFSLASLGTIIACVFLLGTFLSVALNVRSTMQQMEQSVGISVFFEPGISAERKDQIGEEIKKKEDIATMRYVSAEEAWESYKKDVFQGNEELLEGYPADDFLNLTLFGRIFFYRLFHIQFHFESGYTLILYSRPFDTASGAHVHLDETAFDFSAYHAFA